VYLLITYIYLLHDRFRPIVGHHQVWFLYNVPRGDLMLCNLWLSVNMLTAHCFLVPFLACSSILKMEAVCSYEMSVNFYWTAYHCVPEVCGCCESLRPSVKKWIWLLACVCSLDADSLDDSSKTLMHMTQQLQRLVSLYQFIHREHQIPPVYSTVVADDLKSPQVGPHTSSN
jgi:hypothetical protein